MKTSKQRLFGALIIVTCFLALSIALAEIVLRQTYPVGLSGPLHHRIPHPEFGWVLEPNASYRYRVPPQLIPVSYNADGWRDTDHRTDNDDDAFRIVVLGDSFMEAYSVNLEDAFHQNMEQLVKNSAPKVEVINFGVGGYGTLQEYLVFREIGKRFTPDIVLLGLHLGNDIRNNSLTLEEYVSADSMKLTSRPFLDPNTEGPWKITRVDYDGAIGRYSKAKEREESILRQLVNKSALVQAGMRASHRLKNIFSPKNRSAAAKRKDTDTENRDLLRSFAFYGLNYCQEPPEYTEAWSNTKRILDRLAKEVSSIGAKLIVFSVPAIHEVRTDDLRDVPNRELICIEEPPAYARLQSILGELDIEYVDLLPEFRDTMQNKGIKLFNEVDRHWNAKGHDVAANIVYTALQNAGLFSSMQPTQK